jgi:hypothetical protein
MRHSLLAILSLSCVLTVGGGCRQTTSGINGSPLTPISPLAPSSSLFPAPGSNIGPMGGSTRVPPPSTGSAATPTNYLGSATSQAGTQNSLDSLAAVAPQDSLVGSGVQSAGWTETNANLPNSSVTSAGFNEGIGQLPNQPFLQPSSIPKPLPGGMPVIDLTATPYPQGYYPQSFYPQAQPPYFNPPSYSGGGYAQPSAPQPGTYNMNPNGNFGFGTGGSYSEADVTSNGSFAQQNYSSAPTYPSQSFQNAGTPQLGLASPPRSQPPSQPLPTQPSNQPRTATVPSDQQTGNAASNNLMWRRPGARF